MSTRYNNASHYENHQHAAELHEGAAHAHRVAEQHGQGDHLSGHERSRLALEQSQKTHGETDRITGGHGITPFTHADIALRAYELWQIRGCADGSAEQDWFDAAEHLRSRASRADKSSTRTSDEPARTN